jgi:hypothetical protein
MAPGPTALNPAHFSFHPRGPVAPLLKLVSLTSRSHGSASVFRMPSPVHRIALAPLPCGPHESGSSSQFQRNRVHRRHQLRSPRLTRPIPMNLGRDLRHEPPPAPGIKAVRRYSPSSHPHRKESRHNHPSPPFPLSNRGASSCTPLRVLNLRGTFSGVGAPSSGAVVTRDPGNSSPSSPRHRSELEGHL